MNSQNELLLNTFINMLKDLAADDENDFSGAGFVLYEDLLTLSQYHCNLINDGHTVPLLKLGTQRMLDYLFKISKYIHPYHDGFHFINVRGYLTHVAQFLSPPVHKDLPIVLGHGARTFCSQCASKIPGVLMIGTVSTNRCIYLFEDGQLINQSKLGEAA